MIIDMPIEIEKTIEILEFHNYQAYIVGGCVRDSILKKNPNDWDICTNAQPEQIISCFNEHKLIKTGLKHGTITVIIESYNIEITTFRIDKQYINNRKPSGVLFTNNLKLDLKRRDFTINALAYSHKTGVIDFFNGINDIKNKIIKTVGNPDDRLEEDALRILRCLRFSSTLSFAIDKKTIDGLNKNKNLLNNISKERIRDEFNKLLLGDNCFEVLTKYYSIIEIFIPEIKDIVNFEQHNKYHLYDVYKHTLLAIHNSPKNLLIRLAIFFHDIGKPQVFSMDKNNVGHFYNHAVISEQIAFKVLTRLKYDNKTINITCNLIKYHDLQLSNDTFKIKKILFQKLDLETFKMLLEVKTADNLAKNINLSYNNIKTNRKVKEILNDIEKNNHCISVRQLKINGNDLKELGVLDGKKIGEILKELLYEVLSDNEKNNKDYLINKVKNRLE